METRMTSEQVTFRWPFRLEGLDEVQAPGTYTVTTEMERLDTLTVQAWRRISATFRLAHDGVVEHVAIDMAELNEALLRDCDPQLGPPNAPPARKTKARIRETLHLGGNRQ